jgi:WD40 repeat protein/tRNA A-37 threonylcarbamoyl transferase component Bud32
MRDRNCLSGEDLRRFLLGQLPERDEQTILEHLETCQTCAALAAQLDGAADPLVDGLRGLATIAEAGAANTVSRRDDTGTVSIGSTIPPLAAPVPGFDVLDPLGSGGTSVVYKARQSSPDRFVALKMILTSPSSNSDRQARFVDEADTTAKLQHPHIVQIYAAGFHDGLPYLVLEFMGGGSLAQRLTGAPHPAPEAAALVEVLARAAHHAHRQGVVHRDLKPANILFTRDGLPKIADFGLAKHERPDLTATGTVMGTPSYMAPEQARGDNSSVGPAADVYALGVVLYELLTGRPPFRGATVLDTLDQVRTLEPVPPLQLQPKTPRDLNVICLKCLHKEPRKRYASAEELADDLERFRTGKAIRARATGRLEKVRRWSQRNPGWATVAVLLVVLTIGSAVAALRLARALSESEAAHDQTRGARRDAVRQLVRARIDAARSLRMSRRVGQRGAALEQLLRARDEARQFEPPLVEDAELRNEAIACLALPDLTVQREWVSSPPGTVSTDCDATFTFYTRTTGAGAASVRRTADDAEVLALPPTGGPSYTEYSPGGRYFAIWTEGPVHVRVYSTSDANLLLSIPRDEIVRLSFSRDDRRVVFLRKDNSLTLHDLVTGQVSSHPPIGVRGGHMALHPTRSELAVTAAPGAHIYDLNTGKLLAALRLSGNADMVDWNPAGDTLAVTCTDQNVWLWNVGESPWGGRLQTPEPFSTGSAEASWRLRRLSGHKAFGLRALFNSDGRLLASLDWSGVVHVWDVREGRSLMKTAAVWSTLRWGREPDLLGLRYTDGHMRTQRVTDGRLFRLLTHHLTPDRSAYRHRIVFHPGGRWLVGGSETGLAVWDAATGVEIPQRLRPSWHLPVGFDDAGALLTVGASGLKCWPATTTAAGRFDLGPPQQLLPGGNLELPGCSRNGRVVAVPRFNNGAEVLHRDQPGAVTALRGQRDVRFCAVSSDGGRVFTGAHTEGDVFAVVWDGSGNREATLPIREGCSGQFSPDGRWLATGENNQCRLWRVGTWQEHLSIKGVRTPVFSPDGKILALGLGPDTVVLLDPDSGREYARLTAPDELYSAPVCFSPNGSQLAVVGHESRSAHLWDLRGIGEELRRIGLGWDLPTYPPPFEPSPLRVEFSENFPNKK